ncbi:hypothetical protein [Streptomyces poriferorum]|uniref:HNH endonuclease n=1 Tax=Streptomyces poriferorum TaxID=2798799 RepID=A0ABY9IZG0_9ACTN|nr:hypothetical protein [Streptomyces sp. Alt2]WLQ60848.1 hypothetical protein P8A19_37870 [Streptomyces sp. Alt2]
MSRPWGESGEIVCAADTAEPNQASIAALLRPSASGMKCAYTFSAIEGSAWPSHFDTDTTDSRASSCTDADVHLQHLIGARPDCGDRAAYLRHLRRHEPTCPACKAANAEHGIAQRAGTLKEAA